MTIPSRKISFILVLGKLWMPGCSAAQRIPVDARDLESMTDDGQITHDSVESWLYTHAGDFSSITDFYADLEPREGNVLIDWAEEESEYAFNDAMYPEYDEA